MAITLRSIFWAGFLLLASCSRSELPVRPNILFIISDDQSWENAGAYGDTAVRTPNLDRLAQEGLRFEHAFVAAPSCSPSRAGLLTGQDIYRLREGGVLTGFIREEYQVLPAILQDSGYATGSTGKPYWPRTPHVAGAHDEPAGPRYASRRTDGPEGVSRADYVANFDDFLSDLAPETPFFFWVGISEPHLPHAFGRGIETGIDTAMVRVPGFLPDAPEVRSALADYLAEIEWADTVLGGLLESLERKGIRDETLVVYTSDNGMPFPRAKATLYDHGVRTPLVFSWPDGIQSGHLRSTPVSLIDLAPTFLALAGVPPPGSLTGRDLGPVLRGDVPLAPGFVVTAIEKHTHARPDSLGFPRRAIHTAEWTYIRNYEPDRWPAGSEFVFIPNWDIWGDIDPSPIKTYMVQHRNSPADAPLFDLAFGKVPAEELYNRVDDPDMLHNLAGRTEHGAVLDDLRQRLESYLRKTDDPRQRGEAPWDTYYLDF